MSEIKFTGPQSERPTIGLFVYNLEEEYGAGVWSGIDALARERDVNFLCFHGVGSRGSVIYGLANKENLDGLIILTSSLIGAPGLPGLDIGEFCGGYRSLPMVSFGIAVEGVPSVLLDNRQGVRELMTHLVKAHGCRRIAIVRGREGNPEAIERYRCASDVLTEHGIPIVPDLVAPGDFTESAGAEAVRLLLDERNADFEAIVAPNDRAAHGILESLEERGIRVPDDVAVVGFDDYAAAGYLRPPLTTVRQPLYEMGRQAAEMLLALLADEPVPEQVVLPTQLVIRQSCGCAPHDVIEAMVDVEAHPLKGTDLTAWRKEILSDMAQAVESPAVTREWTEQLLDAFSTELGGTPNVFRVAVQDVLHQVAVAGGDVTAWQGALSVLRRHTLPHFNGETRLRAENLWHQARVLIGKTGLQEQAYRGSEAERRARTLREIGGMLITTFDLDELMNIVARELPQLGISSCYLSLYENPLAPVEWSTLILAYNKDGRVELEANGRRFPSRQLVPGEILPSRARYSLVIKPLYFGEDQIGFVLLEAEAGSREKSTHEALREQLSSALKGALLLREREQAKKALEKAYAEVEKQVMERTVELQREVAERERAQEESVRLQREVIDAQRRALQELSTPIIPVMDNILVMPLVGSIDSIRARDITRALLAGIRQHGAQVVILDITGVSIVDSGVAGHLNKTIQAARLKGAHPIITGISEAVAETIVDLGIDWSGIETLADLRTGLVVALGSLGIRLIGS